MDTAGVAPVWLEVSDGVVLLRDRNTTLGYCRFAPSGDIEYLYVQPRHRRQGHGRRLLDEVARVTGRRGRLLPPLSPLGRAFAASVDPDSLAIADDDSILTT